MNTRRIPGAPRVACLALLALALGAPPALADGPVVKEVEVCFCTTPRNGGTAAGERFLGGQSTVEILYRGTWHSVMPMMNESAESIMNKLRMKIIAQAAIDGTDDVVGPVIVDDATKRAVFCVRGSFKGIVSRKGSENDRNIEFTTAKKIDTDATRRQFLRGVQGAFLGAATAAQIRVIISGFQNGLEQVLEVVIPTFLGMDVNQEVLDALDAAGVEAEARDVEVSAGVMAPGFRITNAPGIDMIDGITLGSEDESIDGCTAEVIEQALLINEVDAQGQFGLSDFVELAGATDLVLQGYYVVLFDGATDTAYRAVDLGDIGTVPASGYVVVGAPSTFGVDDFGDGWPNADVLVDGPGAVALWYDPTALLTEAGILGWPAATPPPGATELIDAVVYGTDDRPDLELLAALTPGHPQVNEPSTTPLVDFESIQRRPNFGRAFDTGSYFQGFQSIQGFNAWSDEGCGLAGTAGVPYLAGLGSFGEPWFVSPGEAMLLAGGRRSATLGMFLSLASTPTPFKGGTLKPVPWFKVLFSTTDATGSLTLPFVTPPDVPAGTELWVQVAIQDPVAVAGVALSNAVLGVAP